MKTFRLILTIGLVATVAWSCSDSLSTNSKNNEGFANPPYANAKKVAPADSAIGLAPKIPGFGGLFINKSEQLAIYLTHPDKQRAKAEEVLSNSEFIEEVLSNTSASVSDMVVKQGQYTFIKLYDWEKQIGEAVFEMDGVYSIGIDQSRNKLSVGVENKVIRDSVNKELDQLKIPRDAVLVYKMSPPELY